jgi:hypothetical protein
MHEEFENIPPTPEEIEEYMRTPEGALELQSILEDLRAASPTGGALGQISDLELGQFRAAAPTGGALGQIPDATPGLPPEPIGASPDIFGATRGLLPGASGINPGKENRRRMLQQLMQNQGLW